MSEEKWHYMDGQKSCGPYTEDHITSLIENKIIPPTTLVWSVGGKEWTPANTIFNVQGVLATPIQGKKGKSFHLPRLEKEFFQPSWSETEPHPWRRYFAKIVDITFSGLLVFAVLGYILYAIAPSFTDKLVVAFEEPSGRIFDLLLTGFFAAFLNAIFIGYTGGSIGKFLFGIKVVGQNQKPVGYKTALKRELMIWYRGLGLCLPLISFFTLISAYKTLKEHGKTTWDRDLNLKVLCRNNCAQQIALSTFGLICLIYVSVGLRML